MESPFIGRQQELGVLEQAQRARDSGFIPIYGRRRVGKSELILRFIGNKPAIYYLGKLAPAPLQQREFLQLAATLLNEPLLASHPAENWKQILQAVVERWRRPEKLILALDELQWIVQTSPELPSVLQELWDRSWKKSGNILLILCGSYIGFMERDLLGRKSPLFGRRTAQVFLKPFGYREAALFHPEYSLVDRALAYFICGGVPLYLRFFDGRRSLEQNIMDNLLQEHAPLYQEPEFLLREELRDLEKYYAILLAVSSGSASHQEIARRAGVSERSLPYYLNQLIHLGYVVRRHPLTGGAPTKRGVRYVLDDPLLRFWFHFVYPNMSFISQMGAARALHSCIRPGLDAYFGRCFERLCREALPNLYERAGVSAAFEVGEYWDRHTQIDVVGLRQDGWTDLGECRWGRVRSPAAIQSELEEKVLRFPNPRQASIARHVFTRLKVKPKNSTPAPTHWHSLEDLYCT